MHHRIAAFLLGCWILGSLFMMFVATENFRTADRLLDSPQIQPLIPRLGSQSAQLLLRDMAGEVNQLFFVTWETTQLAIGIALLGFLAFGVKSKALAGLAGGLVVLAALQHFLVTPRMISLVPELHAPAAASDFARLHAVYGIVEVVKLLAAFLMAVLLLPEWHAHSRSSTMPEEAVKVAH
jgi:hypothetical protein